MKRGMRAFLALPLVLLLVPGWAGEERLVTPGSVADVSAERVGLHPDDPAVARAGALVFLGGVALDSDDPAFGGFSALSVQGDRFTLLSDGGTLVRFRMGEDWRPRQARFDAVPSGPETGWRKLERDSESMTTDPRTGRVWIGFERYNQIWRYGPGLARAERWRAPAAMADWPENGGAESMARLRDGRFIVLSESKRPPGRTGDDRTREGLSFAGDPTDPRSAARRFVYRAAPGHRPVDVTELPDGRLLVLERRFQLPFRWTARLALVPRGAARPGRMVEGRTIARLGAPLIADNFEGVAAVREGGATMLWLVSDDNQSRLQRTLLLKFRLDA